MIIHIFGMTNTGKTTLANELKERLDSVEIIDADDYRLTLNKDLGFSPEDRIENVKRLKEVAKQSQASVKVICAITPYEVMRDSNCYNVFLHCPLDILKERDSVKQIYSKPDNVAGVHFPFETPTIPHLQLDTSILSTEECVDSILSYVKAIPKAFFIGRWQPFHKGHEWLINQKLEKGVPVLIGVRDILPDKQNPFTTAQTINIINTLYEGKAVKTIVLPDIESVNYGRNVGYEINEFIPPEDIKQISATFIRNNICNDSWKESVNPKIHDKIKALLLYLKKQLVY
jgi:adenylylsulfate kinase-like enzyme